MRVVIGLALLNLLIGCASEDQPDLCRQSVDARSASRLVAPARSGTGLCNVNGGMTLCRSASETPGDDSAATGPLSVHERESEILQQQCMAAKDRRVGASGN